LMMRVERHMTQEGIEPYQPVALLGGLTFRARQ